jgi:Protein of unknown function (DUF2934)
MSKPAPAKRQQQQSSPTNQKADLAPARPASSSSLRAGAMEALAPAAPRAGRSSPDHEQIARRAYQLWELQGRPAGTDRDNWFEAERLLEVELR